MTGRRRILTDVRTLVSEARGALPANRRAALVREQVGPGFGPAGRVYAGIAPSSTMLSWLTTEALAPRLNVLVPSVDPGTAFAGVKTALTFAHALGDALGLPLRIVTFDRDGAPEPTLSGAFGFGDGIEVIGLGDGRHGSVGDGDLWVATHWTTAHAVDVARRSGMVAADRVVYLVQDYEPGFLPWSSEYAAVRATYHAGFVTVVNSTRLRDHLEQQEGVRVDDGFVIGPNLEFDRLERIRNARTANASVGLFFYARPSKPRNLFTIGVAALRRTAILLGDDARRCTLHTAGEAHAPIAPQGFGGEINHGAMAWDDYFAMLTRCDVGLSLMYSPHPSHPPLDLALAGARVVTNRFGEARDGLHPLVQAVEPDPDALAEALAEQVRLALDGATSPSGAEVQTLAPLGAPLSEVVARVAARLGGTER
ncbi:MAG: hypothetical protein J7513_00495 [Solirubrobacteraceae bacterium]|nr:hypothetical protein [Solirubrobacteraceae bacterium]